VTGKKDHRLTLEFIAVALILWSAVGFFEGSYFAAGFYGVAVPSWAAWVGQLSLTDLNLIDTAFLVIFFVGIVVTYYWGSGVGRRLSGNRRGSTGGTALAVLLIALGVAFLGYLGFTFLGLAGYFRSFFGGL
jgi:hypothetical protein